MTQKSHSKPKASDLSDAYIVEYLVNHLNGDDPWGDASNYPYTFLEGFRGEPFTGFSISEKAAYDSGVYERTFYE